MGTPSKEDWNASLNDWAGSTIQSLIRGRFDPKTTRILDVGAGWGKYSLLLPEYHMDAVEVWRPNVIDNKLAKLYDKVFVDNICDLVIDYYDVVIMGDVFEHLDKFDAIDLLQRLNKLCEEIYVVVPYKYPQEEVEDNPFEWHQQADLTPFQMLVRYPELEMIIEDGNLKGLYCWSQR